MNINLHIERLVLEGVAAGRSALLEAALAAELELLLAGRNLPALLCHGGAISGMGTAPVIQAADPATMGTEVGRALHAGLSDDRVLARRL